jgi:hypothetical protein
MKLAFAILLTAVWTTCFARRPCHPFQPDPCAPSDGESGGPYHNWQLTSRVTSGDPFIRVTVATAPRW